MKSKPTVNDGDGGRAICDDVVAPQSTSIGAVATHVPSMLAGKAAVKRDTTHFSGKLCSARENAP